MHQSHHKRLTILIEYNNLFNLNIKNGIRTDLPIEQIEEWMTYRHIQMISQIAEYEGYSMTE